jgi:hypothetical protein
MTADQLLVEVARYRRALKMIWGCKISCSENINEALWLRELAHEALMGIDPTTGNPWKAEADEVST